MNQSKEMTKLAIAALEDKKANDVRVIDIAGVSVIADYFVIASGSNTNQVQAMADSVREALGRAGHEPRQVEGYGSANWILMDYNDIIVHIFSDGTHRHRISEVSFLLLLYIFPALFASLDRTHSPASHIITPIINLIYLLSWKDAPVSHDQKSGHTIQGKYIPSRFCGCHLFFHSYSFRLCDLPASS